jgi:hypothetical protein
MARIDRGGAFVPVIPFSRNVTGFKREQLISFSGRQNFSPLKYDQSSPKFSRDLLSKSLNSKSELQIAEELLNDLNVERKSSKNYIDLLSPVAKKFLIIFATISSAFFSWVVIPSKGKIISLLFSFVAGGLVYFLLQKFNSRDTSGVQKKILEKINEDNMKSDLTEYVCNLEKEYSLTPDEMRREVLNVYNRFLMFFLKKPNIKLEEVNKLISFKKSFAISSQEIGECHYKCSQEIFNKNLLFLERQSSDESSQIIEKFLFLSDRLFSLDSKKGYQYEISRLKRVLNFSALNFDKTKNKLSEDLYIKSIQSIENSEKIFPSSPTEIKQILGINNERGELINEIIFKEQIKNNISKENGFQKNSIEKLKKLQSILGISDEEFNLYITQEASLFVKEQIGENISGLITITNPQELKQISEGILSTKEKFLVSHSTIMSLYLDSSRSLITNSIKSALISIKSKASLRSTEKIEALLLLSKSLKDLFLILGTNKYEISEKKMMETIQEATQNFSSIEKQSIYRTFVENSLKEPILSEKIENSMDDLQNFLYISKTESIGIYKNVAGPLFKQAVKLAIDENAFTVEKKNSINALISSLKIDENLALILKTSIYRQKLQDLVIIKSVFSPQDLKSMDDIRLFLGLSYINVQNIHDTICEPIFKKSIQEAMGSSGIVPSNYWDGLEKLRKRLRITEGRSKDIFYNVMKERLKVLFEKAIADDKKKKQPKEDAGKDTGEDPTVAKGSGTSLGIEASNPEGNELLNLVEIYFRNRVFTDKEIPSNEKKKELLKGLSGRIETQIKSKAEISFSYPVTLNGLFDKKILSDLYKQYLIECFSSKLQSEKRRLFSNLSKLGPILGLETGEIQTIHSIVGISIYQRFLSQSLSKGFLDNSDTAFLTTIQNTLSMESSVCNNLIKDSKKNKISLAVEKIFASPRIDPDNVVKIRKMADQFNINLKDDLSISNEQRAKLFRIEIDSGIEKGNINNQSLDLIIKIQENYGLENLIAKKILFECVNTRCEGHLLNSIASFRRGDDVGVLKELESMLNFGELLPVKFKNNLISFNEKSQLFSILSSNFGESETQKEKLNLFKTMLDL